MARARDPRRPPLVERAPAARPDEPRSLCRGAAGLPRSRRSTAIRGSGSRCHARIWAAPPADRPTDRGHPVAARAATRAGPPNQPPGQDTDCWPGIDAPAPVRPDWATGRPVRAPLGQPSLFERSAHSRQAVLPGTTAAPLFDPTLPLPSSGNGQPPAWWTSVARFRQDRRPGPVTQIEPASASRSGVRARTEIEPVLDTQLRYAAGSFKPSPMCRFWIAGLIGPTLPSMKAMTSSSSELRVSYRPVKFG